MILDQPFPPDTRVENKAITLAEAGFEVILLILALVTGASIEDYRGFQISRWHLPKN